MIAEALVWQERACAERLLLLLPAAVRSSHDSVARMARPYLKRPDPDLQLALAVVEC